MLRTLIRTAAAGKKTSVCCYSSSSVDWWIALRCSTVRIEDNAVRSLQLRLLTTTYKGLRWKLDLPKSELQLLSSVSFVLISNPSPGLRNEDSGCLLLFICALSILDPSLLFFTKQTTILVSSTSRHYLISSSSTTTSTKTSNDMSDITKVAMVGVRTFNHSTQLTVSYLLRLSKN